MDPAADDVAPGWNTGAATLTCLERPVRRFLDIMSVRDVAARKGDYSPICYATLCSAPVVSYQALHLLCVQHVVSLLVVQYKRIDLTPISQLIVGASLRADRDPHLGASILLSSVT